MCTALVSAKFPGRLPCHGQSVFLVGMVVCDTQEPEAVLDRFVVLASTDTSIIQSSPVVRRLPKL